MSDPITIQSHYLPADACVLIGTAFRIHPIFASVAIVALFGITLTILQRYFKRVGGDVVEIALFFVTLIIFSTACIYLLITHPGYHIYHPGF